MKKRVQSAAALLIALCMILPVIPPPAQAAVADSSVEAEQVRIGGDTSFGSLLGEEIENAKLMAIPPEDAGCVTDLTMNGSTAAVSFQTTRESQLVIAIYEEQSGKMTASGLATVTSQACTAAVPVEGEIPAFFTASAYLLDPLTHEPLSSQFTTRQYTAEMQDFLRKNTEDFEQEQVVDLDGDSQTNFGVLGEETRTVEQSGKSNCLTDNGDTYSVTQATGAFTGLKAGDTISHTAADGTLTLIKVKKIQVTGNTVTITPDTAADLSDFFDYLKIEADSEGSEPRWDNSNLDEGVTAIPGPSTMAQGETGGKGSQSFEVKLEEKLNDRVKGSVTFKLDVAVKGKVKYYLTKNYKQVDVTIDLTLGSSVTATGKVSSKEKRLGRVELPMSVPGVKIGFTPSVVGEASGKLEWDGTLKATIGGGFDTESGFRNLCKAPATESKIKLKGELFLGIKGTPYVAIIDSELAKASLEMTAGLRIQGEESISDKTDDTLRHDCKICIEGTVAPECRVTYGVDIVKDWLTKKSTFTFELMKLDWYYSVDHNQFGIGSTCPYCTHQVKVTVQDPLCNPVKGVRIQNTKLADDPTTDRNGVATFFLPDGTYPFYVYDENHDFAAEQNVTVYRGRREVTLNLFPREYDVAIIAADGEGNFITGATIENTGLAASPRTERKSMLIHAPAAFFRLSRGSYNLTVRYGQLSRDVPLTITTADWEKPITRTVTLGELAASGTCGKNLRWEETKNGTLTISGTGPMTDYSPGDAPWREHPIRQVVMEDGVASIGDYAFQGNSLTKISIPNSVRRIGRRAFGASHVETVTIPDSVTDMEEEVFQNCGELTDVALPSGLTEIAPSMFEACKQLDTVRIPDGVTKIGEEAFYECERLSQIDLPKGVTGIGDYAFAGTGLTAVNLPDGLTELGEGVFAWSQLRSVAVPKHVPKIGSRAFYACASLKNVLLNNGPVEIGYQAFQNCAALEEIIIPDTVTVISMEAFDLCKQLHYIEVGSGVREIWEDAIRCGNGTLQVRFRGDFPSKESSHPGFGYASIFGSNTVAGVYYPADNPTWEALQKVDLGEYFGHSVSFHPYRLDEDEPQEPDRPEVDNCRYTSDLSDDGTVTIRGTGEMRRWTEEEVLTYPPWYCEPELAARIKKAIIEKGATTIGEATFYNCVNLSGVSIPEGVEKIDAMAFAFCSSLPTVSLPEGLTAIGSSAFSECGALEELSLPDSVTELGEGAFNGCTGLDNLRLSQNLTELEKKTFYGCTGFDSYHSLTIPEKVAEVRSFAFGECGELNLSFQGNAPHFEEFAFSGSQVRAFYPAEDPSWADFADHPEDHQYDGTVTWLPNYSFSVPEQPVQPDDPFEGIGGGGSWTSFSDSMDSSGPTLLSAFTGTESGAGERRTVSFTGLAPGAEYLFVAVTNLKADPLLAADNLLYIAQAAADGKGKAVFSYPLDDGMAAQTRAYGKPVRSVSNAAVTAKKRTYNGKRQTAKITVTYDGVRLTEGVDYLLSGELSAVNAGSYAVVVSGLGDYTGTVSTAYTVAKIANQITAASTTKTYSTKKQSFKLGAACLDGAKLTYTSGSTKYLTVTQKGKVTLKAGTPVGKYTVSIQSAATTNRKKAGKKVTVTVNPTGTALSGVKNIKGRKMSVKWKRNTVGSGYDLQYSTDRKFKKGAKTIQITKNKTVSKTVTKLKKGKTYYVRLRTRKTVSGKNYYSAWSSVGKVRISR